LLVSLFWGYKNVAKGSFFGSEVRKYLTRRTPRKTKAVIQWLKHNVRFVPRAAFNTLLSGAKLLDKIMHIPDDIEHQFR
jgi:hypothetical protein